jgi:hypothetical protein
MITRATPFEGFISCLQIYLDDQRFSQFLTDQQSPFTKEGLVNFFNKDIIQKTLARYWDYERGPKWKDRTALEAISETIANSDAMLVGNFNYVIDSEENTQKNDEFQQMTVEQADEFRQKTLLIVTYLQRALHTNT